MAKKDIPLVVSGMGLAMSIITSLADAVRKLGGKDEDIHRLATPEGAGLIQKFAELVVSSITSPFTISVNYSQSLAQMIQVCNFNVIDPNITEQHFPKERSDGKANLHFELVSYKKPMSSAAVLADFSTRKSRLATLLEGLHFVEKNPQEQRNAPIVILGSVWRGSGRRCVPCLYGNSGERGLCLFWLEDDWDEVFRFLSVCES